MEELSGEFSDEDIDAGSLQGVRVEKSVMSELIPIMTAHRSDQDPTRWYSNVVVVFPQCKMHIEEHFHYSPSWPLMLC
jgi:hypothetical protein